jgi:aspartate aminotransferase
MNRLELLGKQLGANQTRVNLDDIFGHLTQAPMDPILGTTIKWKADPSDLKMNLGVGAYRTEQAKPLVFDIVKVVEKELLQDLMEDKVNKEYYII